MKTKKLIYAFSAILSPVILVVIYILVAVLTLTAWPWLSYKAYKTLINKNEISNQSTKLINE